MQRGGDSWHLGNMQELLVRAYSCWQAAVCAGRLRGEGVEGVLCCVVLCCMAVLSSSSGMVNILHGLGLRLLVLGYHTPFVVRI